MECRMGALRDKEIISVSDGTRFGFAGDLIFDLETGEIRSLIIPGRARLFGLLGREEDTVFPWSSIRRFGEDIILVEGAPELKRLPRERLRWL